MKVVEEVELDCVSYISGHTIRSVGKPVLSSVDNDSFRNYVACYRHEGKRAEGRRWMHRVAIVVAVVVVGWTGKLSPMLITKKSFWSVAQKNDRSERELLLLIAGADYSER